MRNLLIKIFDCIFPPHEDTLRVRAMTSQKISSLKNVHLVSNAYILSSYSEPDIRALIHEAKFHENAQAFVLLNVLLSSFLDSYKKQIDIVIPIPLSSARMRERGYNQVYKVLTAQKDTCSYLIATDILVRVRNTQPQTELKREKRLLNLQNAFSVRNPQKIKGKHILLVDDVMTTGATLRTAKAELVKHSPASITCLAFAH